MDTGKLSDSFHASLQRAIVDGSPNGVLVVNQDSAVVSVNERFFSVWGLPIPASPIDNLLFTPDSNQLNQVALLVEHPESFIERVLELYANPEMEDICDILLKDGRTLQRHSTPLRSSSGEYLGRVWYFQDITEIINSRLALDASETRYQTVFQTTFDVIAITRLKDGVYIDINDAFIEKIGYTRDELIGQSALTLNIWFDPADRQQFAERIRNGEDKLLLESRFRKKNGEIFWGMFSVSKMELDGVTCL
ncbi:MAG: PAS domain-containing protein, partial [Azonexus sp.]